MTCARREAGAHRPAASAPSRSPSSGPTPPGDRSRPDPCGGRARLALLLPVLALLLGALGLFAAAPAQAQTAIWSANLTVSYTSDSSTDADMYGCWDGNHDGLDECGAPADALSDVTFTHSSTDYTIVGVYLYDGNLNFALSGLTASATKTALTGLALTVGTGSTARNFAFADATVATRGSLSVLRWTPSPALSWSAGNTVALKLAAAAAPAKPAKPTGLKATAGNGRVKLAWTNPGDSSITKYQVQRRTGTTWGSWADIPNSAPGKANATSYTVTSLMNGTAYRFRIRAVNAAGNSPQSDAVRATPSTSAMIPVSNTGTAVWSATLTVDEASGRDNSSRAYGCDNSNVSGYPLDDCEDQLSDDDFVYPAGGTTYTVYRLEVTGDGSSLLFELDGVTGANAKTALTALTLHVGSSTFAISAATVSGQALRWTSPPSWSDGDTVSLKLTGAASTSKPAKPTGLTATAGNGQVELSWTSPNDASITKYQVQRRTGNSWGNWADIPNSAPGEANATSYTVTSLSNGTAYAFRIRAVNSAGNSPQSDTAGPVTPAVPAGPAVTGALAITSSSGTYTTDDVLEVTVTFDKAIVVTGTPKLTVKVGTADKTATCARKGSTGEDAKKLVCSYTIADGDEDTDGVSVEANKLTLPSGASIKDASDVAATLTHEALGAQSAHKVDAKAPTVTGLSVSSTPAAAGTYTAGETIRVEVTFSETVTVTVGSGDTISLALKVGAATKTAACATHSSDNKKLVCSYTVASGDADADGVSVDSGSLTLGGNAGVEDGQGIPAVLSHSGMSAQSGHKVDTAAPTVTAGSTGYYSDAALSNALTGPLKSGADIYTKVTFSEDMGHTASNAASARPEIFHRIGTTDTQYDILASGGTLASGDCKPNHATKTDVYVCRYTVGSSVNGAFTVKVGTNSKDKANNALAAIYTHATTLTLDTTAPAAPVSLSAAAGNAQVELTWSDPSPADASIAKWQVRQKTTGNYGNWTDVSGGASARSHTVTSLQNGTAYTFQVRAVDTAANNGVAGTAGPVTPAVPAGPAVTGALAITSSSGTYTTDDVLEVTVTFDKAIVVTGTPKLTVKVGTADKTATCARKGSTGEDAKKLVCSYTIADGDEDTDGVSVEANKLTLPSGASIKDASDVAATLTHEALGAQSAHKVDAKAPTVTGLSVSSTPAAAGTYTAGETIRVEVTFSETVTVTVGSGDTISLALKVGAATKTAACATHSSDNKKLVCSYTVARPAGRPPDAGCGRRRHGGMA